jgi:hypothetical protein
MYGGFAIFRAASASIPRRKRIARKNPHGLSTLKIRVKCRLNIWCHRPAVGFSMWGFVCLTGQKDEANA